MPAVPHRTPASSPVRRRVAMAAGAIGLALSAAALAYPALAATTGPVSIAVSPTFASLLYDTDANVGVLTSGNTDGGSVIGPGLTPDRGAMRQEPSGTHMLGVQAADRGARVAKINARALVGQTPTRMAGIIRAAIDHGCTQVIGGTVHDFGCQSHLVTIDEVSPAFATPRSGGAGRLGRDFSRAMVTLSRSDSPWGGTYASRVGIYVDAGVTVSINNGRGTNHNLNGHGRPRYAVFTDVMPGLARAGSLWLEMYQGVHAGSGTAPLTAAQWVTVPARFSSWLRHYGGRVSHEHFLFGHAGAPTAACPDPQACAWTRAATSGINQTILANGPGEYRLGDQAAAWLNQFDQYLPTQVTGAERRW
jgi:hypothetical protein